MCVCVCVCVYSRLQHVCVLSLWRAVLPVREVVRQHGVDQLTHLLLLSGAEQLRVHLKKTHRILDKHSTFLSHRPQTVLTQTQTRVYLLNRGIQIGASKV